MEEESQCGGSFSFFALNLFVSFWNVDFGRGDACVFRFCVIIHA